MCSTSVATYIIEIVFHYTTIFIASVFMFPNVTVSLIILLYDSYSSFVDGVISLQALLRIHKIFHAIFAPVYIMFLFYNFKCSYRRPGIPVGNMFIC